MVQQSPTNESAAATTERAQNAAAINELKELRVQLERFMMSYKFGIDEVMTKINILREEFNLAHDYNPIEHVGSRLKSPESILDKITRKGCSTDFDDVRATILDIAGVRITCSFLSDTYKIRDMIAGQSDLTVLAERDYITTPKENGYKSLHLIVSVPVFMSNGVQDVTVEVQIRTIAMDFWASLEHKIYYKYNRDVPAELLLELKEAASAANRLDVKMERLHDEVAKLREGESAVEGEVNTTNGMRFSSLERVQLPEKIIAAFRARRPLPPIQRD